MIFGVRTSIEHRYTTAAAGGGVKREKKLHSVRLRGVLCKTPGPPSRASFTKLIVRADELNGEGTMPNLTMAGTITIHHL